MRSLAVRKASFTLRAMQSTDMTGLIAFLEAQLGPGLDLLRQMVQINSYTANPKGVNALGVLTAQCFAPLGFTTETVPSTNLNYGNHLVLTRLGKPGGSALSMISHLDTVFPPEEEIRNQFYWQPEGDRIYGPGTQDIKGGTLMMWLVLQSLRAYAPALFESTTWQLFWNSSEEVLSADFGGLCRNRFLPRTRAALVFEAEGRMGKDRLMVVARKGRATWRVRARGRGAHAGGKHRYGANAILQVAQTVDAIAGLTNYSQDLTFNVGMIAGGTVTNRVPHEASAEGEFRAFQPAVYQQAKRALLGLAGPGQVRSVADGYTCQVTTEILTESRPWPRNERTEGLFRIWQKAGEKLGMTVEPEERGGLSDGNDLWDAVPTLDGLGPSGDNDHCSERSADGSKMPEYVEVSSFVPKAALNTIAMIDVLAE
jgi:glutamate carboxypeptidase